VGNAADVGSRHQGSETQAAALFEERKALDEGSAVLIWPRDLSPESVEDMEYWLHGVLRQIKRRAQKLSADKGIFE
jgi:hypothetical protein